MSFGAPNGFPAGTKSPLITPLRMAIIAAELDVRLPATTAKIPPNMYSHDSEFGRLAISTPSYNTAVIKPVAQAEGGLDLSRLFDSRQRPLTTLGAGSLLGAAPGIRLGRGGASVLDNQPGTQTRWQVPGIAAGLHRNRSGTFRTLVASGAMSRGGARIATRHAFATDTITTTYRISRGAATNVTLRMPVWGRSSTIQILRGGKLSKRASCARRCGAALPDDHAGRWHDARRVPGRAATGRDLDGAVRARRPHAAGRARAADPLQGRPRHDALPPRGRGRRSAAPLTLIEARNREGAGVLNVNLV